MDDRGRGYIAELLDGIAGRDTVISRLESELADLRSRIDLRFVTGLEEELAEARRDTARLVTLLRGIENSLDRSCEDPATMHEWVRTFRSYSDEIRAAIDEGVE